MKILATGGSGFIGSFLVDELRKIGHEVFVLSLDKHCKQKDHFIFADITTRNKILDLIPRFKMVYHLAGLLGTSELINKAYDASKVNILGTINILDGALKNKTKVIYVTKPNCWLNTYSITKYAGESFVKMYHDEFRLPTVSVRWFNVYGPNQSFHCQKAVPFFIRWALRNQPLQIWGDGEQTVDLIHARDAVRGTIVVANEKKFEGRTIDVGSGQETTVNNLAELIIKLSNSKSTIRHNAMRPGELVGTHIKADTTELNKMNFHLNENLEKGMKETIDWYRRNL